MSNKRVAVASGVVLLVIAAMLCGMIFGSIGSPCETAWWQTIVLLAGGWCALTKGWGYIVDGLALARPRQTPDR